MGGYLYEKQKLRPLGITAARSNKETFDFGAYVNPEKFISHVPKRKWRI